MENKYKEFSKKRMYIFSELVKRYWNGNLTEVDDLNNLASEIKEKFGFEASDLPFIKNHIRLAMGQDPKDNEEFDDELDMLKSFKKVSQPVVSKLEGPCEHCLKEECECRIIGKYEHQMYKKNKGNEIANVDCLSCGYCVSNCDFGAVVDKIEFMPLVELLKNSEIPVYATVAPAIVGQFGENVSMGQLRSALKIMGFEDMIEVALFADILTIKEAFEFNHLVNNEKDFFLTSCCCPIWFNMIKKSYPDIYDHLSPSVSPMIASGRILKSLYPDAKVVFIAPCIAKKGEIKDPDLEGAIDYTLNFRELKEIFEVLDINLNSLKSDEKDQASFGGRIYARSGGVSFSVKTIVNRLQPSRVIKLNAKKITGIKECKKVLNDLRNEKEVDANFIEGMGCKGGCVGGPRTNIDVEKSTKLVNEFGEDSFILTPFDNLNVMKILEQFGVDSVQEIMLNQYIKDILSRE